MKVSKSKLFVASMILFSVIATFGVVYADSSGSSTGTAHVSSAVPTVTLPEYWNLAENTDVNNTALTVNTQYHINFTVSDANTMADLDNVTIRVWLDGTATENASDAEANHYSFTWVESTDTWACPLAAGYIVGANCSDPGTAGATQTYEFRLAFKFSQVAAHAATPAWKVSIFVWDDSDNADSDKTLMSGTAFFSLISVTDATHAWEASGSLVPGSYTNETVDGDGDIDFTVIANAAWDAQTMANGDLTNGTNTIALGNLLVHEDTLGSAINMTTGYLDVGGLTSEAATTAEGSPTAAKETLWLTVPAGTMPGDYVYVLSIQIVEA